MQIQLLKLIEEIEKHVGCDRQSAVRDLLTDLRWVCRAQSVDWDAAIKGAEAVFNEESRRYLVVHLSSGDTVGDGFSTEDDAFQWLVEACKEGKLDPSDLDEYAVEEAEE